MKTIQELLDEKGRQVWSIGSMRSVYDALALMAEKNIGAVTVVDDERLVGIFSERDFTREVVLQERAAKDTPVRDVMTGRPVCVAPEQTVEGCLALMTEKRVRHLPVVEHDKVVGLVSIGDAVKAVISEQQFTIEQLEHYISG